jgi:hypothetical protein
MCVCVCFATYQVILRSMSSAHSGVYD